MCFFGMDKKIRITFRMCGRKKGRKKGRIIFFQKFFEALRRIKNWLWKIVNSEKLELKEEIEDNWKC